MTEDREPLEQLLDLALYAPLGLAVLAREHLPDLADRGRRELEARVLAARLVGQMVLDQGANEVKKRVDDLPRRLKEVLRAAGLLEFCSGRAADESPGAGDDRDETPGTESAAPASASASVDPVGPSVAPEPPAPPADLPIPGYDTLSASQVVQRLAGLSPSELDAVRSYEAAQRGRKTVLLRVAQLQAVS